jgi:hypothetical protein
MAHDAQSSVRSGVPVVMLKDSGIELPNFTFVPRAGSVALDDIDTDLVLLTKLYRMDIPAALHATESNAGSILRQTVKGGFSGKKGSTKLLHVPLRNSHGELGRHMLLVGLGPAGSYNGQTACQVFETFFRTAFELDVESVLIPFCPNPMTKQLLTHRATAFKLKSVLSKLVKDRGGLGKLREVKIYCAPPAVRHINSGLSIEQGDDCRCASHAAFGRR